MSTEQLTAAIQERMKEQARLLLRMAQALADGDITALNALAFEMAESVLALRASGELLRRQTEQEQITTN